MAPNTSQKRTAPREASAWERNTSLLRRWKHNPLRTFKRTPRLIPRIDGPTPRTWGHHPF